MADVFEVGGPTARYWNFTKPEKEGYTLTIEGTVVEIIREIKRDFMTKELLYWKDSGRPQLQWKFLLLQPDGEEVIWKFDDKLSGAGVKACINALSNGQGGKVVFDRFLGKYIRVSTGNGKYGLGNARPFGVEILRDGDAGAVRGCHDYSRETQQPQAQPQPQPQPAYQPQPQPQQPYPQTPLEAAQAMAQRAVAQNNGAFPVQGQPSQPMNGYPAQVDAGVYDRDIPF